jgi:hypothetical protein
MLLYLRGIMGKNSFYDDDDDDDDVGDEKGAH